MSSPTRTGPHHGAGARGGFARRPQRRRRLPAAAARGVGGVLVAVAAVAAGFGWLYLLRRSGVLAAGPRLSEALPLQRLAGGSAQPLERLVVVWLSAGVAAGAALSAIGYRRRLLRAAFMFAVCLALLLAAGAAADAVTANEALRSQVAAEPHREVIWLAAALVAAGALVAGGRSRRSARALR